eukprot:g29104.t1
MADCTMKNYCFPDRLKLTTPIKNLLVNKTQLVPITTSLPATSRDVGLVLVLHLERFSSSSSGTNGIEAAFTSDSEVSSTLDGGGVPTVSDRPSGSSEGQIWFAPAPFMRQHVTGIGVPAGIYPHPRSGSIRFNLMQSLPWY